MILAHPSRPQWERPLCERVLSWERQLHKQPRLSPKVKFSWWEIPRGKRKRERGGKKGSARDFEKKRKVGTWSESGSSDAKESVVGYERGVGPEEIVESD